MAKQLDLEDLAQVGFTHEREEHLVPCNGFGSRKGARLELLIRQANRYKGVELRREVRSTSER